MYINVLNDFIRRRRLKRLEFKSRVFKTIESSFNNFFLEKNERFIISKLKQKKIGKIKSTSVRNVCLITGRARGVFLKGFSRHKLRHLQIMGVLSNIKKIN